MSTSVSLKSLLKSRSLRRVKRKRKNDGSARSFAESDEPRYVVDSIGWFRTGGVYMRALGTYNAPGLIPGVTITFIPGILPE